MNQVQTGVRRTGFTGGSHGDCICLSSMLGLSVLLGLSVADLLLPDSEAGLENECGTQYARSGDHLKERCA